MSPEKHACTRCAGLRIMSNEPVKNVPDTKMYEALSFLSEGEKSEAPEKIIPKKAIKIWRINSMRLLYTQLEWKCKIYGNNYTKKRQNDN